MLARHPQHVTLRVVRDVGWLRRPRLYRAIRRALVTVLAHHDFRIVHFSVQGDHVHLLCEAADRIALARGVQGFEIAAAKRINQELSRQRGTKRTGKVFADRYHVTSVDSVRQVGHALSYVLNNWRKHGQDRTTIGLFDGRIDPFSSGVWFAGWKERTRPIELPPDYEPPRVAAPQTWLLTEGWKRAAPISVYAVPAKLSPRQRS